MRVTLCRVVDYADKLSLAVRIGRIVAWRLGIIDEGRIPTGQFGQTEATMNLLLANDASSWLDRYSDYLRDVVGTTSTTRTRYSRIVRCFVAACFGDGDGWAKLSVQQIVDFVREETASKKRGGRKMPMTAVRSFLRFLAWRGVVPSGLDRAIPRTRLARHASLPRHLSADQIDRLLEAANTGKAQRRDRAILLLLVRLGLRCAEIIAMEMDDIDWRAGCLRICVGKTRRERVLPLPQDAGTALADYIEHDRPSGLGSAVFFGANIPASALRCPTAITCMVKRNLVRARIPLGRLSGAHMLRHTVASRLVNSGASFKEVADLLGHESLHTTAIYAKLDLAALAHVAMPWIGGAR
jgi:site-specific recombinase XerD